MARKKKKDEVGITLRRKSLYEAQRKIQRTRAPARARQRKGRWQPIWDPLPIEETLLFAWERFRRDLEEEI